MRPSLPAIFGALGAGESIAAVVTVHKGGPDETEFDTMVLEVGAYNEPWPPEGGMNSLTKMRRRFGLILADLDTPTEIPYGTEIAFENGDTFTVEATDVIDNERAIVLARQVP